MSLTRSGGNGTLLRHKFFTAKVPVMAYLVQRRKV